MKNKEFKYNITNLINEELEKCNAMSMFHCGLELLDIKDFGSREYLIYGLQTKNCPTILLTYSVTNNQTCFEAELLGIANDIPTDKITRLVETCNELNRFSFFNLHVVENFVVGTYTAPLILPDECTGPIAVEAVMRADSFLETFYPVFFVAIYTEEDISEYLEYRIEKTTKEIQMVMRKNGTDIMENESCEKIDNHLIPKMLS